MKTLSTLLILGCAQVLSANYYQGYDRGYDGYNSGYQDGQGYQGQAYYQGQGNQGYSQRAEQPIQYQQAPKNPNDWSRADQGQQYHNPNQVNTSNWDNGVSDDEINRKVKEALSAGWISKGYPEVTSEVRMGIVTLRGTVDTIENKTKVDEAVRKIAGVKGLNNQITVDANYKKDDSKEMKYTENKYSQDAGATPEDRALNAKIREKLKGGLFSRGFDAIILRTSNGIVLITGTVDSNDDVVKVHDQVKAVDGVRDVNNQLTVKNK